LYSKNAKILFLGLDNAGKTTLLHLLTTDKLGVHAPTHHPGEGELKINNVHFKAHDLGGHEAARKLWATYSQDVDAVVYLVDASDIERFPESKKELDALLASEKLLNTPFLILGNKIDLATAVSEEQLKMQLGLTGATTGKETTALPKDMRPIEVYMCSIMRKTGYGEGLKWLTNFV